MPPLAVTVPGAIGANGTCLEPRVNQVTSLVTVIDSRLPRFAQSVQAVLLAVAFLLDWRVVVPLLAVVLTAAYLGGPRWSFFWYLYRALPIPRGEPEPAPPHRFAQGLGALFLWVGSAGLYGARPDTLPWWIVGWGAPLAVAALAAVAAATAY